MDLNSRSDTKNNSMTKTCTRCNKVKPLSEYRTSTAYKNGYTAWCKECFREVGKIRYRNKKHQLTLVVKKYHDSIPPAVYAIVDKTTNEFLYIGSSKKPYVRITQHFTRILSDKYISKSPIQIGILNGELNRNNLDYRILELVNEEDLRRKEQEWLSKIQTRYNSNRAVSTIDPNVDTEKYCYTCKKSKQLNEFSIDRRNKDGYFRQCKECNAIYQSNKKVNITKSNIAKWI